MHLVLYIPSYKDKNFYHVPYIIFLSNYIAAEGLLILRY